MLEKSIAFSGFAAGNLEKVKEFCTKTPGLMATEDHGLLMSGKRGQSTYLD